MIDIHKPPQPDFSSFASAPVATRRIKNLMFMVLCWLVTFSTLVVLAILLLAIGISAWPVMQSRSDVLESNCWAQIVQGKNEGNNPDAIDDGDILQGIFVAQRLEVGGLTPEQDVIYSSGDAPTESKVGVFSFRLHQNRSEPHILDCLPASGQHSVANILDRAGIAAPAGKDAETSLDEALIAVLNHSGAIWDATDLAASEGLIRDQKIGGVFGGDDDWQCEMVVASTEHPHFCQFILEQSFLADKEGDETTALPLIDMAPVKKLRRKANLGRLSGLFEVLSHHEHDAEAFVPVKNRSLTSDEIVTGAVALTAKDGRLQGLSRSAKQGFQFGGTINLTHNIDPDQGSSVDHAGAFLTQTPKTNPNEAGIGPALSGTLWVCLGCALFALPLGIGTAICLEEFKPKNRAFAFLHGLVQLNISNLAGVPSIVYGIVGLTAFGTMFGLFGSPKEPAFEFGAKHYFQYISEGQTFLKILAVEGNSGEDESNWVAPKLVDGMDALMGDKPVSLHLVGPDDELPTDPSVLARTLYFDAEGGPVPIKPWYYFQLPFGRGVLAASLTLMLVILPVIIIASQEALRAVPSTLRQGALGLGSTRWQTVRNVTLPAAIPSIMTGAILAMSRAVGEAAPIIVLAGIVYISAGPQHLMDSYSVLPVQIYHWAGLPIDNLATINWQHVASAGIVVLLVILFSFNAIAITIRQWTQKPLS